MVNRIKNNELIELRLSLGLTQLEASNILNINRTTYQNWEYGLIKKIKNIDHIKLILLKYKDKK